jgi:hypothetical protein
MLINAQEDFAFLKSIFVEPFKGGGGGGGSGGGGRGGSSRRNSDPNRPLNLPIFIFFVALYSLAFLFSSTQK